MGGAILRAAVGVLVARLDPWVKPVVAFASRTSDALWYSAAGHRDVPPDPPPIDAPHQEVLALA